MGSEGRFGCLTGSAQVKVLAKTIEPRLAAMAEKTPLKKTDAEGAWSSGLCACCGDRATALDPDCGLCCTICCLAPIPTGQLYERSVLKGLISRWGGRPPISGMVITMTLALLYVAFLICDMSAAMSPSAAALAPVFMTIYGVLALLVLCNVRKSIRKRDNIPPGCGGEACNDCCCSFWCWECTMCQIWRHEGVVFSKNYSLCSATGEPVSV